MFANPVFITPSILTQENVYMFPHTLVIRVCKIIRLLFPQQRVIPTHAEMEEHVKLTLMNPAVTVVFVHGDIQDSTVKVRAKRNNQTRLSYLDGIRQEIELF